MLGGSDPDAVVGKHLWRDLFPGDKGNVGAPHIFGAMNEHVPVTFETYYAPWDAWYRGRNRPDA